MGRLFLLLIFSTTLAHASCPRWRGPARMSGAGGEVRCAKHREALQELTIYGPGGGVCILFQPTKEMMQARACSPNALPLGVERKRSELYSRPTQVWFCARCEAEVQAQLKRGSR
ncbi:MAG: hypothetical protein ABI992_09965 [Chthoniobacterales bacterium]